MGPFQFDVKNMARFESPLQIFGLFLCAALVAIGVIFVLNLEVDKRYGNERNVRSPKEMLVDNEDKISLFARFRHNLENLWSWSRPRQKRSIEGEESQKTTKLSENLLTESLNGHKLRNVAMKVARLNPQKDQITKEILDQFCRPKMVNCSLPNEDSKLDLENHQFPLLSNKEENETILQFKDEPMVQTVYVCEDYGNVIIAILVTTLVNFSFIGLIWLCRKITFYCCNDDHEDKICTQCCITNQHDALQEIVDDEIYGIENNSPIIKSHLVL